MLKTPFETVRLFDVLYNWESLSEGLKVCLRLSVRDILSETLCSKLSETHCSKLSFYWKALIQSAPHWLCILQTAFDQIIARIIDSSPSCGRPAGRRGTQWEIHWIKSRKSSLEKLFWYQIFLAENFYLKLFYLQPENLKQKPQTKTWKPQTEIVLHRRKIRQLPVDHEIW